MSLKAFHIVFIIVSTLLSFGLAVWSGVSYSHTSRIGDLLLGLGSLLAGIALLVYGRYFLKKLKNISYL